MDWESSGVVGFDLGSLLQGQMRTAKLKRYNLHWFSDTLGLVISKSIVDTQFLSDNSFIYFWESFHMVKFQTRR